MPHRVLVIDDSALVLEVVRTALQEAGYEVATVMTVEAFEAERRRARPSAIVVDVQMPEIFGDDLARTIREVYGEEAPIVLLSSLPDEELAQRAQEIEARGWVPKRLGMTALLAKLREILPA